MNLIRCCWAEHCSDRQEDGNVSKIKSYTNLSGNVTVHYDEDGNKVGESWVSASGGQVTHYDADGNKTGVSFKSPSGHMTHYDNNWNKHGHSQITYPGQVKHYDNEYNQTGESNQGFFSMNTSGGPRGSSSGHGASGANVGCATMLFMTIATIVILCIIF